MIAIGKGFRTLGERGEEIKNIIPQTIKQQKLFVHNSPGWRAKIKVPARLVLGETFRPGMQFHFAVPSQGLASVCAGG